MDLVPLLEDTLTLLEHRLAAEGSGNQRAAQLSTMPEAWVLADGDKLKQVFWNFCENAVRAMQKTGGNADRDRLPTGCRTGRSSFTDTGPGMPPQQTEKIFEPFQSNFEGGTGLGLAIVYQIVQAHEGKVWARSKLGKGTTFVLRLRRMEQRSRRSQTRACASRTPRGRAPAAAAQEERMGNILVCDDERSICEMLDIALRRDGHKVETVTGGERPSARSTARCTT